MDTTALLANWDTSQWFVVLRDAAADVAELVVWRHIALQQVLPEQPVNC
jgi:hypothetical protein